MDKSSVAAVGAALGGFLLTLALLLSPGLLYLPSLILIILALGVILTAACWRCSRRLQEEAQRLLPLAMRCIVALNFIGFSVFTIGFVWYEGVLQTPFVVAMLLLGVLTANYLCRRPVLRGWSFLAILFVYLFLGGWQIHFSPAPSIDVWHFQQQACGFLLKGENPYAAEYADMEEPRYYGQTMVKDGRVQAFPYPPLSLLLALPGYCLGDVRWSILGAVVGAAGLMAAVGRRRVGEHALLSERAAVAFLFHPLGLFVLDRAWTEPFLCLAVVLCLWGVASERKGVVAAGLAAVLSAKQYGILWMAPMALSRRFSWRSAVVAVVLASAVVLPFFLWDPPAFWRSVVQFHLASPFRPDTLSVLAAVAVYTAWQPPAVVGFLAALTTALILWARSTSSLTQATLGTAGVFLSFFVFGKQGDLNYYWFVGFLLTAAIAVSANESSPSEKTEGERTENGRTGGRL